MANIGTIQVLGFRRSHQTNRIRLRRLRKIFCPKGSYCVPLSTQDRLHKGTLELQYGSRYGHLLPLEERSKQLSELFSVIWVRKYNEGDDHDECLMIDYDHPSLSYAGVASYVFDEARLFIADPLYNRRTVEGFDQKSNGEWRRLYPTTTYASSNPRTVWNENRGFHTPTTMTDERYLVKWPAVVSPQLQALMISDKTCSTRLDLLWKGRVVKRLIPDARGEIKQFNSDHWDNFVTASFQEMRAAHQSQWRL